MIEEKMTAEKLQKIFDDKETRKDLLLRVELLQRERFLHREAERLRMEIDKLDVKIQCKHNLSLLNSVMLDIICEEQEQKNLIKLYERDYVGKKIVKKKVKDGSGT